MLYRRHQFNVADTSIISACVRNIMSNTQRRRDETVLSCRRRRCEHNSQLAQDDCRRIRSRIWKLTKQAQ